MRMWKGKNMPSIYNFLSDILITIWGYELSYLEFIAFITSIIAVSLGITGKRITWPWWAVSSVLFGIFFLQLELFASAALQIIFIIAAIFGWFGWEPTGAKPGPLRNRYRVATFVAIITATAALAALADSPSHLRGIGHLRLHETDRLAALTREINALGGNVVEEETALHITPAPLHAGVFHTYEDHRLATAGAVIGLVVPGIEVENIATTRKTLPDFPGLWSSLLV